MQYAIYLVIYYSRNIGEDNSLLVCINCFHSFIKVPTSGGSSNVRERNQQKVITKRIKLHEIISNGRKQYRK